jgi:hypothetical protein
MTHDAPPNRLNQADLLAADLYRLHEAGVTVFPAVALAYAAAATSLHRRRDDLDVVAALLRHDAPRAVADLLGLLQDGMGDTARACDAAGRALVDLARRYAGADDRTRAAFGTLLRERGPDLLVPSATFRPPPGSGDPAFTDALLHGPKDAA